jgi:hypothetical protein
MAENWQRCRRGGTTAAALGQRKGPGRETVLHESSNMCTSTFTATATATATAMEICGRSDAAITGGLAWLVAAHARGARSRHTVQPPASSLQTAAHIVYHAWRRSRAPPAVSSHSAPRTAALVCEHVFHGHVPVRSGDRTPLRRGSTAKRATTTYVNLRCCRRHRRKHAT